MGLAAARLQHHDQRQQSEVIRAIVLGHSLCLTPGGPVHHWFRRVRASTRSAVGRAASRARTLSGRLLIIPLPSSISVCAPVPLPRPPLHLPLSVSACHHAIVSAPELGPKKDARATGILRRRLPLLLPLSLRVTGMMLR